MITKSLATRHRFSLRDLDDLRPDAPDSLLDFCVERLHGYHCDVSQIVLTPPRSRISGVEIVSRHRQHTGRLRRLDLSEIAHDGIPVWRSCVAVDAWDFPEIVRHLVRQAMNPDYLLADQPLLAADGTGIALRHDAEASRILSARTGTDLRALFTNSCGDRFPAVLIGRQEVMA